MPTQRRRIRGWGRWEGGSMLALSPRPGRAPIRRSWGSGALPLGFAAWLAACSAAPSPAPPAQPAPIPPASTAPAAPPAPTTPTAAVRAPERWDDAVLYFVLLDRFADGDPGNNVKVDRQAKGAFHGGDFAGLTQH